MSELGQTVSNNVFNSFIEKVQNDKKIKVLGNKARIATDYQVANEYAVRVGELASQALQEETKGLAFISQEVAKEVLEPVLTTNHELVKIVAEHVQQNMNQANGLGLKALVPDLDTSRIDGLISKVSSYATAEEGNWVLGEPIINYTQAIVDQAIHKNSMAHSKLGLEPVIIRKCESAGVRYRKRGNKAYRYLVPCKWCLKMEGTYDYDDVSNTGNNVFRRHEQCRCIIYYKEGNRIEDVYSHKTWIESDSDKLQDAIDEIQRSNEERNALKTEEKRLQRNTMQQFMNDLSISANEASGLYSNVQSKMRKNRYMTFKQAVNEAVEEYKNVLAIKRRNMT